MKKYLIVIAMAIARLACTKEEASNDDVAIVSNIGNTNDEVNEFRQLPGQPLKTTGNAPKGRLEINSDSGADSLMVPPLPVSFLKPIE
jgi:hypothetical protein